MDNRQPQYPYEDIAASKEQVGQYFRTKMELAQPRWLRSLDEESDYNYLVQSFDEDHKTARRVLEADGPDKNCLSIFESQHTSFSTPLERFLTITTENEQNVTLARVEMNALSIREGSMLNTAARRIENLSCTVNKDEEYDGSSNGYLTPGLAASENGESTGQMSPRTPTSTGELSFDKKELELLLGHMGGCFQDA